MEWLFIIGGGWVLWKLFFAPDNTPPSIYEWPKTHPPAEPETKLPYTPTEYRHVKKPKPKKMKKIKIPDIDLSIKAKQALKAVAAGDNLFISGAAGTGKSTFLQYLLSQIGEEKNFIVLAPTGVAALNVRGQTVHSFFKFGIHILAKANIRSVPDKEPFQNIDIIIIDEISMVRADIFDSINRFMRKNGKDRNLPFGGAQVLLFGDLFQLPPVVTRDDKEYFEQLYDCPFFFNTNAFRNGEFKCIEFTKIYRQKERKFINILNKVRVGDVDTDLLSQINSRCISQLPISKISQSDPVILTGRNATASRINTLELDNIEAESYAYKGTITGTFGLKEQKLPAPIDLTLKEGAKVMFTKNDRAKRWVNGTLGIVESLTEDTISIRLPNEVVSVEKEKWESIKHIYNEDKNKWEAQVVGTYSQFPLMLAWAVTIHKSQGQTLDSCLIDLEGGAFASGQTYVALSRCQTFEKLFLKQDINMADIRVDKDVLHFMEELNMKNTK